MADQIITRRRRLLAEIRRVGGRYTTGQAHRFYQATGWGPCRTTARKDLQWWTRRGALVETGTVNNRGYWIAS
ncbi:hypothetical protein [Streptomyces caniscabiei]|uniref:hypothetical protein n=1 Tax=Streptomyces caniscabiei TaxID=2746961 RepID=UPI0029A4F949|nr:hypothetical protein [Streptomyces caniscabiei]MDX2954544.1 hypothetical protein [Streptomyces caniscabiei]